MDSPEQIMEKSRNRFPEVSDLELHFYGMKYWGAWETEMEDEGSRPVFYLFDNEGFSLISFMISERDSPYNADGSTILFDDESLPFETVKAVRLGYKLPHYYFRGPVSPLHPTLDGENILNTSFNPRCTENCDFCFFGYRNRHLKNTTAGEGLQAVMDENDMEDFSGLDEIAIVTGRLPTEEKLRDHIVETIQYARDHGFTGRIFYIGSQLTSPSSISSILNELGDNERFRYAFTVERFFDRDVIMHGRKGKKDHSQIVEDLKGLRSMGVDHLQYTYLVGIENLDDFMRGAEELVPYATPHISIFRKTGLLANEQSRSPDYVRMGPEYTCAIKRHYEQLYGGPEIGNNFANLWPFPIERVNIGQYLDRISDPLEVQNV